VKHLVTNNFPFEDPLKVEENIRWGEPKLLCEVAYAEMTADGQLRQTRFLGWRDDKKANDASR
jgi:bifunctional non-homologous end joining protein LigD